MSLHFGPWMKKKLFAFGHVSDETQDGAVLVLSLSLVSSDRPALLLVRRIFDFQVA